MNALSKLVETPLAQAVGEALFHFLWQGTVIAALLAALLMVLRPRPARVRYVAAVVALLAMPLAFAATLAWLWPDSRATGLLRLPATGGLTEVAAASSGPSQTLPFALSERLRWAAPLWLAGVCVLLICRGASWVAAQRLRRRGTSPAPKTWQTALDDLARSMKLARPVLLLESCLAEVPVVIGYLRPAILAPVGMLAGLPAAQVEAVLLHELAHIRRADYLVNLLQTAIEALLFYHPAVWWVSNLVRAERENCCDDAVLALRPDARVYAEALVTLERSRWRVPEAAVAANGGSLLRRVRRMLGKPQGHTLTPALPAAVLLVSAVAVLTAWQTPAPPPSRQAMTPYEKWVREDVAYIIRDEERAAFERLQSNPEREQFIEQFWLRRDPLPGTQVNEFKAEHYRRIANANERFSEAAVPGWKTDRGQVYIIYGPPDEKETRPSDPAGASEVWRYRVGFDVVFRQTGSGWALSPQDGPTFDGVATGDAMAFAPRHAQVRVIPGRVATVTVPLNFASGLVSVSGSADGWKFEETVNAAATNVFSKRASLPPGAYVLEVTAKDLATGVVYKELVRFQVH